MTFTFTARSSVDREEMQRAVRAQSSVTEDEVIAVNPEKLSSLAAASIAISELEDLASQGLTITEEFLGELGRSGFDDLSDGITGGIQNHRESLKVDGHAGMQRSISILEQRAEKVRRNPDNDAETKSSGNTLDNTRNQADNTQSALEQTVEKVSDGWEAGREFGANPTKENGQKAVCKVAGNVFSLLAIVGTKSIALGGTTYALVTKGCDWLMNLDWDPQEERRRRQRENQNSRPWYRTPHPDEAHGEVPHHLQDLVDRDLASERIRNMNPRIDPHETESSGFERIVEFVEIINSLDLVHGGTSTGAFFENGTVRLDQSDFAGFLGSNGGTSTGGDQLI